MLSYDPFVFMDTPAQDLHNEFEIMGWQGDKANIFTLASIEILDVFYFALVARHQFSCHPCVYHVLKVVAQHMQQTVQSFGVLARLHNLFELGGCPFDISLPVEEFHKDQAQPLQLSNSMLFCFNYSQKVCFLLLFLFLFLVIVTQEQPESPDPSIPILMLLPLFEHLSQPVVHKNQRVF